MITNGKHVNLVILTPGHSLMGSYVESLLKTTQELDRLGITWAFSNEYASHVADARELTLSATYNNNIMDSSPFSGEVQYDKLLWIDSDIAWEPSDVLRLYYSDKDIISGAYLMANGQVMWQKRLLGEFYTYEEVKDLTEPFEIFGSGFGFVCVKRGIFESLSRPWFQSAPGSYGFGDTAINFNIIGEDLSWCSRVMNIGYKIYADPSVKVMHHKMMKLTWEGIQP